MSDTIGSVLAQEGTSVWSVGTGYPFYEAIAIMMEKGVGALLVISHGALLGIVSERDYAPKSSCRAVLQGIR